MRNIFVIQITSLLVITTIAACIDIPLAEAQAGPSNKIELTSEERQWLEEHKENIRFGPSPNYPPIGFVENGEYKGVTAGFLRVIGKRLNISFNMVYSETWNELMEKARAGKVDLVGNIQNTPERRKFLRFTRPYIRIPNSIIVKQDFKGSLSPSQMDGMKIAIVKGYSSLAYVKTKYPGMIIVPVRDNPAGLQMVSFGRADAMITDLAVASYFIEGLGISNLRVAGSIDYVWDLRFAVRKDWPQLTTLLNKVLDTISESQRKKITNRWISLLPKGWQPGPQFWIALAGVIVVFLIIGILVWTLTLRRQVQTRTLDLQTELAERKRAEAALLEGEIEYRELYENAPNAYFSVRASDGLVLRCNAAAQHLLGYDKKTIMGMKVFDLYADRPEGKSKAHRIFKRFMAGELIRDVELQMKRQNGDPVWISLSVEPVRDDAGTIVESRSVVIDISKRRQAEETLKRERDFTSAVLSVAGALVVVLDSEGRIVRFNRACEKLTGYSFQEVKDRHFWDLFLIKEEVEPVKTVFEDLQSGQFPNEHENYWLTKDGSRRIIAWSNTAILDREGAVEHVIGTGIDITEQKRAEKALRKAHNQLERRDEKRTEKLRHLSARLLYAHEEESRRIGQELHDGLAQTLSAVKVWGEAAVEHVGQKGSVKVLNSLETVVSLTQGAIEEVRRISLNLRPSLLDDLGLLAAISWLCSDFEASHSGISIEKQIDIQENDMPAPLKITIFRISQEALNNVGKHSEANLVRFSLRRIDGNKIVLTVTDNGTGFELDHVRSGVPLARGLGLDGMKERAELSGGSFSIESSKDTGTTVRASWQC